MGRRKLLEFLPNASEKQKLLSHKVRKQTLFRKLHELTTLCGVDACAIMYDKSNPQKEAEIWPPNPDAVKKIISEYREKGAYRSYGMSDFLDGEDKKGKGKGKLLMDDDDDEKRKGKGKLVIDVDDDTKRKGKGKLVIDDDDDDDDDDEDDNDDGDGDEGDLNRTETSRFINKIENRRLAKSLVTNSTGPELADFMARLEVQREKVQARIAELTLGQSGGVGVDQTTTNLVDSEPGRASPVHGLVTDQQAVSSSRPSDQQVFSFPSSSCIPLTANPALTVPWPVFTFPRPNDIPVPANTSPLREQLAILFPESSDMPVQDGDNNLSASVEQQDEQMIDDDDDDDDEHDGLDPMSMTLMLMHSHKINPAQHDPALWPTLLEAAMKGSQGPNDMREPVNRSFMSKTQVFSLSRPNDNSVLANFPLAAGGQPYTGPSPNDMRVPVNWSLTSKKQTSSLPKPNGKSLTSKKQVPSLPRPNHKSSMSNKQGSFLPRPNGKSSMSSLSQQVAILFPESSDMQVYTVPSSNDRHVPVNESLTTNQPVFSSPRPNNIPMLANMSLTSKQQSISLPRSSDMLVHNAHNNPSASVEQHDEQMIDDDVDEHDGLDPMSMTLMLMHSHKIDPAQHDPALWPTLLEAAMNRNQVPNDMHEPVNRSLMSKTQVFSLPRPNDKSVLANFPLAAGGQPYSVPSPNDMCAPVNWSSTSKKQAPSLPRPNNKSSTSKKQGSSLPRPNNKSSTSKKQASSLRRPNDKSLMSKKQTFCSPRPDDISVPDNLPLTAGRQAYTLPSPNDRHVPVNESLTTNQPAISSPRPNDIPMPANGSLLSNQQSISLPRSSDMPVHDGHNNPSASAEQQDQQMIDDDDDDDDGLDPSSMMLMMLHSHKIDPAQHDPALWPTLLEAAMKGNPGPASLPRPPPAENVQADPKRSRT